MKPERKRLISLPVIQEVTDWPITIAPQSVIQILCPMEKIDWNRWMTHITALPVEEFNQKYMAMDLAMNEALR